MLDLSQTEPFSYRSDASVPDFPDDRPIIVFDAECRFCSRWVQFALKHDKVARYRFLPAQSELGMALYRHYGLNPTHYESNILLQDGRASVEADGSMRMIAGLGLPWSMVTVARVLPRPVLDWAYRLVARNRYRWFGRMQCYVPTMEMRSRFLA